MKYFTLLTLVLALSLSAFSQEFKSGAFESSMDSVLLGPGYANDVYYSFEDGVVSVVPRSNWDIAFHTTIWSATIITNGASTSNGVFLYTYPNADTAGWASVDTVGMAGWSMLYDSEDSWEDGAFSRNATGHPDYGWGKYNPISHDVVGDSIYILKTSEGLVKKLWIQRKHSAGNTYYIRHANLDGSDEQEQELNINPYTSKNFVYYSFNTNELIDREPDTASWDILFTKYMAIQPNGTPYPVIGVYNNFEVYSNMFHPVGPDFIDYMSMPFDSTKSPIGWEWKTFDMGTFTWSVADSTAFFVHTRKNNVYKLVFTKFEGSSTGNIVFSKESMTNSGVFENESAGTLKIYPNPVKDMLNIDLGTDHRGEAEVYMFDITGRQVYHDSMMAEGGVISFALPSGAKLQGMYMLRVNTGKGIYTSRFIVF
jgi:hypothetical protein